MSLPDSPSSPAPRWAPTHVQVTVLQAQGLRSKAKGGGSSDAYAVMALGKEKFATSVAERCLGSPVWREEATFELPSLPRRGLGGAGGPGPNAVLQLSVLHRALLGLDKFLGRAEISLGELQSEGGRRSTRWYKLHSKPGKKAKERGEIEVDIQFMRSNMTASMFDLSVKDKPRTPFSKLKNKLKGKRGIGLPDTASAIIPSITHSPADSEEESNEKEKKKSKFKTLFSKPGLHKSNISQSMSVLPTLQPVSERVRLRPSDFQSQWSDDEDDDTLTTASEKPSTNRINNNVLGPPSVMTHKRAGSGDSKQLNQIIAGSAKKDVHSLFGLRSKNDPVSRSNLCINGSHVYMEENESKSDLASKEGTPSSPQTTQRKRFFSSQENLSLEHDKELENSARLPLDKLPPGTSSLESFKAMSLPSYKLLAGGDLVENNTPFVSDTPKETKEIKKQENKKSGLLSLVTGKKETKTSEEVRSTDSSLKAKEVKRNEKESARKEINPFELPADGKKGHGSPKSNTTDVVITKTSKNPFNENIVEEEKSEKNAASVKPSQTKPVKPRLGVSSEDETKATSFPSVPLPPVCYPSNNENNPFTSKFDTAQKSQEVGMFASLNNVSVNNPFTTKWMQDSKVLESSAISTCLPSTSGCENNPFTPKWGQEPQMQELETSSLYSLHSAASITETQKIPSQLSKINDPFAIKVRQESERIKSPPISISSVSLTGNIDNSKYPDDVSSEKFQNQNLINQTDTTSNFADTLSESLAPQASDLVRVNQKASYNKVHTVLPFKEKNGMEKSVALAGSKEDVISSHNDSADEDSFEVNENKEALNLFEKNSGQVIELNIESSYGSKSDEDIISVQTHGNPSEMEVESGLSKKEPPVPIARILVPPQSNMSVPELSDKTNTVPPKPAPRNGLKVKKYVPLTDEPKGDVSSHASVLKEVSSDSPTFSEKPSHISSLTSEMAVLPHRYNSNTDPSLSIKDEINHIMKTSLGTSGPGELNVKPITLPVIPEVASDDEQLGDYQQNPESATLSEDLSKNEDSFMNLWASAERTDLTSTKKAIGETVSSLMQMSSFGNSSNRLLKDPTNHVPKNPNHNLTSIEKECGEHSKKDRQDHCPESSAKPVSLYPLSDSSQSCSVSSFQSDSHGFNKAESPKKGTAEELDAKVESSGRKKLLQAWVSPSEKHPNPGESSAKLRLHPVKPMNATTNQPSGKTLSINTKMLDNQTEINLKKYDRSDPAYAYAQLTHDELIQLVLKQKNILAKRDVQVRELEDYIDNLLVRVMEATPNILRIEVHPKKKAGKM
ncbi:rab11 family-interacting protein 1 [Erythrolamprus reginae]|uniref:rab11 family-interacting protein 1 n=1 Tax=Erythrolamprus reginae TaxID=121349 RepID=UPI00396CF282